MRESLYASVYRIAEGVSSGHPPCAGSLYRGSAGACLFLFRAGQVLAKPRWCERAAELLAALDWTADPQLDFFSGALGELWARSAILGADVGSDEAVRGLLKRLERSAPYRGPDLVGGLAGDILGLLALPEGRWGPETEHILLLLATALLEAAQPGPLGPYWRVGPSFRRPLCGVSHGNAGVAYILQKLALLSPHGALARWAARAWQYENAHVETLPGRWPEFRSIRSPRGGVWWPGPEETRAHWCHGILGNIRVTRVGEPRVSHALNWERLAKLAMPTASLGYCHGAAGWLDTLLEGRSSGIEVAEVLADQRLEQDAVRALTLLEERPPADDDHSLFLGRVGLGDVFLRILEPQALPSMLDVSTRATVSEAAALALNEVALHAERRLLERAYAITRHVCLPGNGGGVQEKPDPETEVNQGREEVAGVLSAIDHAFSVDLTVHAAPELNKHGSSQADSGLLKRVQAALEACANQREMAALALRSLALDLFGQLVEAVSDHHDLSEGQAAAQRALTASSVPTVQSGSCFTLAPWCVLPFLEQHEGLAWPWCLELTSYGHLWHRVGERTLTAFYALREQGLPVTSDTRAALQPLLERGWVTVTHPSGLEALSLPFSNSLQYQGPWPAALGEWARALRTLELGAWGRVVLAHPFAVREGARR